MSLATRKPAAFALIAFGALAACAQPAARLVGRGLIGTTSGGTVPGSSTSTTSGSSSGTGTSTSGSSTSASANSTGTGGGTSMSSSGSSSGGTTTSGNVACGTNAFWRGDVCVRLDCTDAALLSPCLLSNGAVGSCAAGSCQAFDPLSDSQNCGGFGIVCPVGASCEYGGCVATDAGLEGICPAGMRELPYGANGSCVWQTCDDSLRDQACFQGEESGSGICCGQACIPVASDPNNCGACGRSCGAGELCVSSPYLELGNSWNPLPGTCVAVPGCDSGQDNSACQLDSGIGFCCGGVCLDGTFDQDNCGACGQICPYDGGCFWGGCYPLSNTPVCDLCPSRTSCNWNDSRCAVTDCQDVEDGLICTAQDSTALMQCCAGACVDPAADSSNCGVCGLQCPADTACLWGLCLSRVNCAEGSNGESCQLEDGGSTGGICCGGRCVDSFNDPANCEGCGLVCPHGYFCSENCGCCNDGGGYLPVTPAPTTCGPQTEDMECVLEFGAIGLCCHGSCSAANYYQCGAYAGACDAGSDCAAGTLCVAGTCWDTACPPDSNGDACLFGYIEPPYSLYTTGVCCSGNCINPYEDPNNCGGCGVACASGICSSWNGLCLPAQPDTDCLGGCAPGSICARGLCVDSFCQNPLYSPANLTSYSPGLPTVYIYGRPPFSTVEAGPFFCAASDGNVGMCGGPGGDLCSDLANDPLNCGEFGVVCPAGQTCTHGVCSGTPPECGLGQINRLCDLDAGLTYVCCPGIGCTDLTTDNANCGLCGLICPAGQNCLAATCQ